MVCYLHGWMLAAELRLTEAHAGLENEIPVRTCKQEKKPMIYALSSSHLHGANADLDGHHEGRPWAEMAFPPRLFSILPFGCKTHGNGNVMLLDSEK